MLLKERYTALLGWLKGARLYLLPSRKGSFLNEILVIIEQHQFIMGVGAGVAANAFYDFLRFSISKAAGLQEEPYTPYVTKLNTKDEPYFDALGEAMEGPLLDGHRPIMKSGGTISVERPRSKLLMLDKKTLDWVSTRDENPTEEEIVGTVTRYNVISGDPPPLNWSTVYFSKRRIKDGNETTQTRGNCHQAATG